MAKIIIMQGLPGSGKSTLAKELLGKGGNLVRINKDLLRTMLHFDKWHFKNESLTKHVARMLAKDFLSRNVSVIIDDTNLNPGTVQGWVDIAKEFDAKIEYHKLDTPIEECIRRDNKRKEEGQRYVGKTVIQKMAMQYFDYLKGEKVVVCDLDGTLCDVEWRRHFVDKEVGHKDWKSFFAGIPDDPIRMDVLDKLLKYEAEGCKIILVSARQEQHREATEIWLEKAFKGYPLATALIMRENHDGQPDTKVKGDIYERYLKQMNIIKVIDDRPSVIRMWREKGLDVDDVGKGIDF